MRSPVPNHFQDEVAETVRFVMTRRYQQRERHALHYPKGEPDVFHASTREHRLARKEGPGISPDTMHRTPYPYIPTMA